MDFFSPRKLVFKAWNRETKLLMRLNNIECAKGELFKKDHVLLQFTGLHDRNEDELYEMDVVMIGSEKHVVLWDSSRSGWSLASIKNHQITQPLLRETSGKATRLWSYFETDGG